MNNKFKIIKVSDQSMVENYRLMIASISPRPIAFVGTQDGNGNDNLAPFSFFNGFDLMITPKSLHHLYIFGQNIFFSF